MTSGATSAIATTASARGAGRTIEDDAGGPALGLDGALAVLVIMLAAGAFLDLLYAWPTGGAVIRGIWISVFGLCAVAAAMHMGLRPILRTALRLPTMLAVLGLALLSTAWSILPAATAVRSMSLVGLSLIGVYLGVALPRPALLRVLTIALACLVLASLLAVALAPAYAIMPAALSHGWKGIVAHKNVAGAVAAFAVVLLVTRAAVDGFQPIPLIGLLLPCLVLLVMSRSLTASLMVLAGLAFIGLVLGLRRGLVTVFVIALYVLALVAAAATFPSLDLLLDAVGKDPTLSERVRIWADARALIAMQPFLGHGYEAVWGHAATTPLRGFETLYWANHAHNGVLHLATEIGVPGAVLAFLVVLGVLLRAARAHFRDGSSVSLYAAAFALMLLVENLVESTLLNYQNIQWLLLVALAAAVVQNGARRSHGPW